MDKKFRIYVVESERGEHQHHWCEDFDTEEQAWDRIHKINSGNTADTVSDWYMRAEIRVEAVNSGMIPSHR